MLHIDEAELLRVRLPLVGPFETSLGTLYEKDALIVRLRHGEAVGWGEVAAWADPWFSEESVVTAAYALGSYLVPSLLRDGDLESMHRSIRGHPMAKAGLEAAALDLAGRLSGEPLVAMLGGTPGAVPVGISIGIQGTPAELARIVAPSLEQGYRRIKVKIRPGWDIEPLRELRRQFGVFELSADANGAYPSADLDHLRSLDEIGLTVLEQPFRPEDLFSHARLQAQMVTRVCLDESVGSVDAMEVAVLLGAGRVLNIKPGRVGGLSRAARMQARASELGIGTFTGGMLETGIGRAANLAFARLTDGTIAHDLSPSRRYFERDVLRQPIEMDEDGMIQVPAGPGIGVEVDEPWLQQICVERTVLPGD